MRYLLNVICLVLFCASINVAQKVDQQAKIQFALAPRDVVLQAVAVQPDCPIRFENLNYLLGVEGGGSTSYELRNVGTKPIREVTVATSNGTLNTYGPFASNALIMPGELLPKGENTRDEIVPLTEKLRDKLKLKNQMLIVIVLMVVSVEFADGTKYDDQATYERLAARSEHLMLTEDVYKDYKSKLPKRLN